MNSPEGLTTFPLTIMQEGDALSVVVRRPTDSGGLGPEEVLFTGTYTAPNVHFFWALDYNGMMLEVNLAGEERDGVLSGPADFSGLAVGDWSLRRAR
jgi:hypothetical protein